MQHAADVKIFISKFPDKELFFLMRSFATLVSQKRTAFQPKLGHYNPVWPPTPRSHELVMPEPFNRRLFVYNSRMANGRSRSTVLAISTAKSRPLLYLNREEFEALLKASEDVKAELVNFQKKLQ